MQFGFNIDRSPAPDHVLAKMIKAAGAFQNATGCRLAAMANDQSMEGPSQLMAAVADVIAALARLGMKSGAAKAIGSAL